MPTHIFINFNLIDMLRAYVDTFKEYRPITRKILNNYSFRGYNSYYSANINWHLSLPKQGSVVAQCSILSENRHWYPKAFLWLDSSITTIQQAVETGDNWVHKNWKNGEAYFSYFSLLILLVPGAGIEPARPWSRKILSLVCLPISPSGQYCGVF